MRDLVVVGASAGGVEALSGLAAGLPASVLVVLHLPVGGTSALAAILGRSGPLPAHSARNGRPLEHGHIYVAPPNHHLLVVDGTAALSHGPSENGRRPAINALFRSAAIVGGPRVTGVLLSGVLDDGVAGLVSIAAGADRSSCRTRRRRRTNDIARTDPADQVSMEPEMVGPISGFTCPDCDGSLVELEPGTRYRCRVGHAWTADELLDAQGAAWERALWMAIRTLDEKASLSRRMTGQAKDRGATGLADRYQLAADEATDAAALPRAPLTIAGRADPEGLSPP